MTNPKTYVVNKDKLGNAVLIGDVTFLFLLLLLFFTLKDEFWAGIISFSCGFLIAVAYLLYIQIKDN